jgi:Skp family chaperone for outer membrane proteins
MRRDRVAWLGWVLAAAFAAVLVGGGAQAPSLKVGVVDIARVVEQSEFGKGNQASFAALKTSRESLLEFIDTNRVLTAEQAQRLRDLTVKPSPTNEEKAEAERIRADVVAANKKWAELSTKPNLTAEERTLLEEYARRSQAMAEYAQRLLNQFTDEMQRWADRQKVASLERARAAVREVAKAQEYSLVLEVGVAPYGANDLTDEALKAMNAKP